MKPPRQVEISSAAQTMSLDEWMSELPSLLLHEAIHDPLRSALFSADMVVGFCDSGNLASPRIGALAPTVVSLFERAYEAGLRSFVLLHDAHAFDALEFETFPPHCVAGTDESQAIPELRALPFSSLFEIVEKNTLHPAYGTRLDAWLDDHPELRTAIVVGDCTDFCVYHAAMHLRMRANALHTTGFEVIVPADAVDTYDAPGHDGDFFHRVFLYHLALSGVRVVRSLS